MRHMTLALALLAGLLAALPALANSTIARGVLVSAVDAGGKTARSVTIRSELSTPRDAEDMHTTWEVPATSVVLLDGAKADFAAFVPGRLVILCRDCSFFRVYSKSFHFAQPEGDINEASAWWTVTLKGACVAKMAGEAKPSPAADILLHLQTRDGKVTAAAAVTPGWGGAYGAGTAWHEVDAAGLAVAEGKLAGACTITLLSSPGTKFDGDTTTRALAVTLTAPVAGEGAFAVADGAKGKTASRVQQAPAIPAEWYAFLRAPGGASPGDGAAAKPGLLRAGFRVRDGKAEGDFTGSTKLGEGAKPTSIAATLADGRLKAEIGFKGAVCALDAFVIGDRFFGTFTTKAGEKTWTGHASGYLEEADAPSANWGEGDARKDLLAATKPAA